MIFYSPHKGALHCLGIGKDADDWAIVSVSGLYVASAALIYWIQAQLP